MSFNNFIQMELDFQKNSILAGSAEHCWDLVGIREERLSQLSQDLEDLEKQDLNCWFDFQKGFGCIK
jgi:hypothetical protein